MDVLSEFLRGVVGVGDSDGDRATAELDVVPQRESLASDEMIALGTDDRRPMSLSLGSTEVLTREP